MSNERATQTMRRLFERGGPFDYDPAQFRLVVGVMRALAEGRPVTTDRVARLAREAGIAPDDADALLHPMTERNAAGDIVGAYGLSLNDYPHRFFLDGVRFSTWCAEDALFMPMVLDRSAVVESPSPLSGKTIRVQINPRQVEDVEPADAVVSLVIVDSVARAVNCREALQGAICQQIHFFASRAEAEQWAAGRDDIEILSIAEGFQLARLPAARFLGLAA
jgi:alkylmercury lyase